MITNASALRGPNQRLMKNAEVILDPNKEMREGFWSVQNIPFAVPKSWEGRWLFLAKLRKLEDTLQPKLFRGFSTCVLCKKTNPMTEYKSKNWTWPGDFKHYVEDHNVKPTVKFHKFVCS